MPVNENLQNASELIAFIKKFRGDGQLFPYFNDMTPEEQEAYMSLSEHEKALYNDTVTFLNLFKKPEDMHTVYRD